MADLDQGIIAHHASSGAEHRPAASSSPHHPTSSPPRKPSNPQQGMAGTSSLGAAAAAASSVTNGTACTSPLTVTSLEAAAAAGTAAAREANDGGSCTVPQVVSRVVPIPQQHPVVMVHKPQVVRMSDGNNDVESMLSVPMAGLGLGSQPSMAPPASARRIDVAPPPPPTAAAEGEKKSRLRTPPTEHDNRKLFVGGLPTDVSEHGFLEFFQQFGEVLDSVVMVDRLTKRSRGFGFVTFAKEDDANSLLTDIPNKSGYVTINGKQCEVKASTPKVDDPAGRHNHAPRGATGMWRSNLVHHQYGHRRGHRPNGAGGAYHPTARGEGRQYYVNREYPNGDNVAAVDGRNFDEVYSRQMHAGYAGGQQQPYGRGYAPSNMYNYQYSIAQGQGGGYAYANAVPSSWEASYPASSAPAHGYYPSDATFGNDGGYANNTSTAGGNNDYGDRYSAQQQQQLYAQGPYSVPYGSSQYANQYNVGQQQQQPPTGQYVGYPAEGESPQQRGAAAVDGDGYEPYPYPNDEYGRAAGGVERYE